MLLFVVQMQLLNPALKLFHVSLLQALQLLSAVLQHLHPAVHLQADALLPVKIQVLLQHVTVLIIISNVHKVVLHVHLAILHVLLSLVRILHLHTVF